jgi:hypothetical protein
MKKEKKSQVVLIATVAMRGRMGKRFVPYVSLTISRAVYTVLLQKLAISSHTLARLFYFLCRLPVHPSDNVKCILNWNNDDSEQQKRRDTLAERQVVSVSRPKT